jgi:predicted nuclease of predicted toxin-antitoxin system
MLRLLADENLNGDIVRGLLLRQPDLDLVRVQDVGLAGMDDAGILAWSADNDRIVVTHDRATMPDHASDRMTAGQPMGGVFIIPDRLPVGQAIREMLLLSECSNQAEWRDCVVYLPL